MERIDQDYLDFFKSLFNKMRPLVFKGHIKQSDRRLLL